MKTILTKDLSKKRIFVSRSFTADVSHVWKAWTEPELLDEWWAPKPWKAETISMDFREGGIWLYCMIGPDQSRSYSRADYKTINHLHNFTADESFCDESGNIDTSFPSMFWDTKFIGKENETTVNVEIIFKSIEDLQKIIEMGFEEGFSAAHDNLDELLSKNFQRIHH